MQILNLTRPALAKRSRAKIIAHGINVISFLAVASLAFPLLTITTQHFA